MLPGDEGGDPDGVRAGVGVVSVQLNQVVQRQHDADYVHEDPQEVDDIMTKGTLKIARVVNAVL